MPYSRLELIKKRKIKADLQLGLAKKTQSDRTIEDLELFETGRWKKLGQVVRVYKGTALSHSYYISERGEEHIYRGREATLALAFESGKVSWGIDADVLAFLASISVRVLCFYRKQTSTYYATTIYRFARDMYFDENPPFQKQVFQKFSFFNTKTKAISERKVASMMSL
jgi:hypothetical protein